MATAPTTEPMTPAASVAAPSRNPPALETGDQLTRDEFERRYTAMPHVKKAELIEGVVYMGSPVRADGHGNQQGDFVTYLGTYRLGTPNVFVSDNVSVRLD